MLPERQKVEEICLKQPLGCKSRVSRVLGFEFGVPGSVKGFDRGIWV